MGKRRGTAQAPDGKVRIIGGTWRGRRLEFPAVEGLRPTPDRMRETLFNWLQPIVEGSHCLDLFAGSGALGFEALSRGASSCTFIERSAPAARALLENARRLEAAGAVVVQADAIAWLGARRHPPFDLVFLDPPFRTGLLAPALAACTDGLVADGGRIYLETGVEETIALPDGWATLRQTTTGQVACSLLARHG